MNKGKNIDCLESDLQQKFHKTKFEIYDYFFGYSIDYKLNREERNELLVALKRRTVDKISGSITRKQIERTYKEFDYKIGFDKFDLIIYPDVSKNMLVKCMVDNLKDYCLKHNYKKTYKANFYEISKTNPKEISLEGVTKDAILQSNKWLEEIHKLDYFSIAINGGKFRKNARQFLEITDINLHDRIMKGNNSLNILIIDDICTTGSTIREILRKINKNNKCNIEILTLIGKDNKQIEPKIIIPKDYDELNPIPDNKIDCTCMKCLKEYKKDDIHHIKVPVSGYMSRWDGFGTKINLCDDCYKESIKENRDLWKMEFVDYSETTEYGKNGGKFDRCSSINEEGDGIYDIDPDYVYEDEGYTGWPILKYESQIFDFIFGLPDVSKELVFNRLSFGFNSDLYKSKDGDPIDWMIDKSTRFI